MHFEWRHVVEARETDWIGHASNVAFVDWLQSAAIAHSSALGWTPERYLSFGSAFMVRSHRVTYLGQARVGEALIVRTWVEDVSSAKSLRRYEMFTVEDSRPLARAETIWAFVDLKKGMPKRIPDEILEAFPVRTRLDASAGGVPGKWPLSEW